jgi:hypothetical protein
MIKDKKDDKISKLYIFFSKLFNLFYHNDYIYLKSFIVSFIIKFYKFYKLSILVNVKKTIIFPASIQKY